MIDLTEHADRLIQQINSKRQMPMYVTYSGSIEILYDSLQAIDRLIQEKITELLCNFDDGSDYRLHSFDITPIKNVILHEGRDESGEYGYEEIDRRVVITLIGIRKI